MPFLWRVSRREIHFGPRPLVMGIVNVTPDSFSDGGILGTADGAVRHGLKLIEDGANILDIGGESTRPGAVPVDVNEELRRVLPVVAELANLTDVPISVDTSKAEVARQCLQVGAVIINDVTGLRGDAEMAGVIRDHHAGLIAMHMLGTPATMQIAPQYANVLADVLGFFDERLQFFNSAGIAHEQVVLDPGIGFGKKVEHNLTLLAGLAEFKRLERPVCLGVSRKGLLGKVLDRPVEQRLAGSLACAAYAWSRGAAQVMRVHDVRETQDFFTMWLEIDKRRQ